MSASVYLLTLIFLKDVILTLTFLLQAGYYIVKGLFVEANLKYLEFLDLFCKLNLNGNTNQIFDLAYPSLSKKTTVVY